MSPTAVHDVIVPPARRTMRPMGALVLVGIAVALVVAACWSPASRYPDDPAMSPFTAHTLKAQIRTMAFQGPAWRLQVVEAAPGATADELPDARLAWRTLFSV